MALARNHFAVFTRISIIKSRLYSLFPGVIVSMIVATTAQFLADHYSTPVMLLALLLGVTVLSTMAMVAYPVVVHVLDIGETGGGVFLGGTIHDVAQVVGAGFSISEPIGDTATLVKLIRVSLLAPVVLVASVIIQRFVQTLSLIHI